MILFVLCVRKIAQYYRSNARKSFTRGDFRLLYSYRIDPYRIAFCMAVQNTGYKLLDKIS